MDWPAGHYSSTIVVQQIVSPFLWAPVDRCGGAGLIVICFVQLIYHLMRSVMRNRAVCWPLDRVHWHQDNNKKRPFGDSEESKETADHDRCICCR